jgi:hypothetical protein
MLTMQKTIYKHFFYNKNLPEWPKLFCLMVMEEEISILARKHAEDIISAWNEFKEEKHTLAGAPVEISSLIPCAKCKQSGNRAFCEGILNFIWRNPFGEKQV